ncbi:class I SAM-dependent methyltransferase [Marinicella sp. W31]|uniref:class I SAM-dependent methyltransferase n=1 Tax=Marinicella sp. W31 TaxID=3023713 RepID=UPI0037581112
MKNNPQYEQMADDSMVRCLDAQAAAIWPYEKPIFENYGLSGNLQVLDLGCGTCELSYRMLQHFEQSTITAVDMIQDHLDYAAQKYAAFGDRLQVQQGDALELDLPADHFDLSICRHMLQAVPDAKGVMANMIHVTKPGGVIHLLAEDYGMLHFSNNTPDLDAFWREGPWKFAEETGTDLRSGRKVVHYAHQLGLENIQCHILSLDTINTPRELLYAIFAAWKDGYAEPIAEHSSFTLKESQDFFDQILNCVEDPQQYALWNIPVITATKPLT